MSDNESDDNNNMQDVLRELAATKSDLNKILKSDVFNDVKLMRKAIKVKQEELLKMMEDQGRDEITFEGMTVKVDNKVKTKHNVELLSKMVDEKVLNEYLDQVSTEQHKLKVSNVTTKSKPSLTQ